MAVGQVLRESLLSVRTLPVKTDEDIEKGELVCDDGSGNGLVAATAALAVTEKVYMAQEAHDYSEVSYHYIQVVEVGYIEVQKLAGTAINEGDKVIVSSTAGEVTVFVKGDAPAGGVSTYYTATIETNVQAAMDKNAGVIGTCTADAASDATTAKILLGVV
jgi:hypothetical protein